ncbi:hypothetical protein BC829DRAFT_54967 [Chytridium lagenaria]|nr:hypothetical protein BC829DRAFT_54967 [Chytridium lagenaria]
MRDGSQSCMAYIIDMVQQLDADMSSSFSSPSLRSNCSMTDQEEYDSLKAPFERAIASAFLAAVELGHTDITQYLIDTCSIDPATNDNWPISKACMRGHTDTVRLLLTYPTVLPNAHGNLALISSSGNGNLDIVKMLVDSGKCDLGWETNRAFQVACQGGFVGILEVLVAGGVDPRVWCKFWALEGGGEWS